MPFHIETPDWVVAAVELADGTPLVTQAPRGLGRVVLFHTTANADWSDLALLPNASTAVNTVLAGLKLNAGDELLMNDHEYPACQNTLRYYAGRAGAKVVRVGLPFPIAGPDEVVRAYESGVTPRTRLAPARHVTSPPGLAFPVARGVSAMPQPSRRRMDPAGSSSPC